MYVKYMYVFIFDAPHIYGEASNKKYILVKYLKPRHPTPVSQNTLPVSYQLRRCIVCEINWGHESQFKFGRPTTCNTS